MSDTGTNVCCHRCSQRLAVERGGVLLAGSQSFEQPVRLRCRICAHETAWLPPRARAVLEAAAEPPETRTNRAVKGLWFKDAA
jgi:hypothetical protein